MSKKSFLPLIAAAFFCSTIPAWSQSELPEGNGKRAVQTYCVQCHDLSTVTRAGYRREGMAKQSRHDDQCRRYVA